MKDFPHLIQYAFIYAKNYLLESLAVRFPKTSLFTPKPLYVGLSVGTVCNFTCKQCDLWRMKTRPNKYLKLIEIKRILKDLRDWLGPFRLIFTGAEPFVRKDILAIIKFCSQNDIYTVLTSNGWLINQELAGNIVESGLDVINISLDGANAKTHDFLRTKKGAFAQAIKALKFLVKAKERTPTIYVNSVIMEPNVDQLVDLAKLAKKLGADNIRFQALESKYLFGDKQYDPFWFKKEPLWPQNWQKLAKKTEDLKKLKKQGLPIKNTFKELKELKLYYQDPFLLVKRQKYCFTGVRNFAIDEYGKVKLCFGMEPVGDLLKENPQAIWYGKKAQRLRQTIAHCQYACRILPCNKREELNQVVGVFFKELFKCLNENK